MDPAPVPTPMDPALVPTPKDPAPVPTPEDPASVPTPMNPAPVPTPMDPAPVPTPEGPAPMYAIGGSANLSSSQQMMIVTKRESAAEDEGWKSWNWRSDGDLLLNGARFIASGNATAATYAKHPSSIVARPASLLRSIIIPAAGVVNCRIGQPC
ncbi:hypothetical protein SASPL_114277 [Salvia splendens]|uniref:Uncharacterized protein n=1 Tax=Salvia splendens TaxID=180675 RepID=A0A8X8ZZ70_SALSN|nr:hypothetical protein SASPL_114277 [Salvia splendens]